MDDNYLDTLINILGSGIEPVGKIEIFKKIRRLCLNKFHAVIILSLLLLPLNLMANQVEQHLKTAFIFKFCGYVQWPESAFASNDAPFQIGIMGSQSSVKEINELLETQTVLNRKFIVKNVDSEQSAKGVHVLYVLEGYGEQLSDLRLLENNLAILTITEERILPEHSVINFILQNDQVRFEISKSRAETVGLTISSQLLSVAVRVE